MKVPISGCQLIIQWLWTAVTDAVFFIAQTRITERRVGCWL